MYINGIGRDVEVTQSDTFRVAKVSLSRHTSNGVVTITESRTVGGRCDLAAIDAAVTAAEDSARSVLEHLTGRVTR